MYPSSDWKAVGTRTDEDDDASLVVTGMVEMPTPGYKIRLAEARPGINPNIKRLTLEVEQLDGVWPEVITPMEARWEGRVLGSTTDVEVIDHANVPVTWQ